MDNAVLQMMGLRSSCLMPFIYYKTSHIFPRPKRSLSTDAMWAIHSGWPAASVPSSRGIYYFRPLLQAPTFISRNPFEIDLSWVARALISPASLPTKDHLDWSYLSKQESGKTAKGSIVLHSIVVSSLEVRSD